MNFDGSRFCDQATTFLWPQIEDLLYKALTHKCVAVLADLSFHEQFAQVL